MGDGGGSSQMTQTTKVEVPKWYEKYAQDATKRAYSASTDPYPNYGGVRVSPLTTEQETGLNMITNRATQGSPLLPAAQSEALNILKGNYLDPGTNPAWDAMSKRLSDAYTTGTSPTTNAAFSKANAFGSDNSAFNEYKNLQNRAYGDSQAALLGDIYNQERANMLKTMAFAPSLAQADYSDPQALIGAGDARRQYNQDVANVQFEDFWNQQMWPWEQLSRFGGLAPAFLGNQGATIQTGPNPYQSSPLAGAVAGGLLGAGASGLLGSAGVGGATMGMAGFPYLWPLLGVGALAGGLLS